MMHSDRFPQSDWDIFKSLKSLHLPRPIRLLIWLIMSFLVLAGLFMWFTPWVQTAAGNGVVTTLDPRDRLQTVTAMVSGRVETWFVREGQEVKAGDPIVRLIDNDPRLIERIESERAATERQLEAARRARETARIDYERKQRLEAEGLSSRLDLETARIKYEEMKAREASAAAALNRIEVTQSRLQSQTVVAPRDGVVLTLNAGDNATMVKEGQALATFLPLNVERVVELFVDGRDAPLVRPGHKARLMFEGWPTMQFSGWPSVAVGTFGGIVQFIDPVASRNGLFRVLIIEDKNDYPWPDEHFIRLGAGARGTVLLNEVSVGYEIWRRLNNFPPQMPTGLIGEAP
ncbi:RND transporter [Iodidimonas nitroreducens]|uniref:RND transporter n=1 Tax=Iodidimonas nitroreducens TaxID=1236968 RepID=A0A5A7N767_9PROT|nr:HlyD family efflux transporter periplasmic adaptor subunit [Iodidimonas nitroreducens]GAK34036.1 macrolide-specific efflux protein MacA precursor [alpha proteobacterium Q-1]GER02866.1 RND transporter [Iodidimonas nitroreducens]